jgi:hypothetical protein
VAGSTPLITLHGGLPQKTSARAPLKEKRTMAARCIIPATKQRRRRPSLPRSLCPCQHNDVFVYVPGVVAVSVAAHTGRSGPKRKFVWFWLGKDTCDACRAALAAWQSRSRRLKTWVVTVGCRLASCARHSEECSATCAVSRMMNSKQIEALATAISCPPSPPLPSPPLRDNNSSWLRGLKFVLDTYAKSWGQIQ